MTSESDVKRVFPQRFFFHCSCGAAIDTTESKITCSDCGETVEVIRQATTSHGKKYSLRISRHRREWNPSPLRWAWGWRGGSQATSISPPLRSHQRRYVTLGFLFLLLPFCVPPFMHGVALSRSNLRMQQLAGPKILESPKPDDCGWFDGCHYEPEVISSRSGSAQIVWRRVPD
jgi:hypothetical protein